MSCKRADRILNIVEEACHTFVSILFSELSGVELTTIATEAFYDVTVTWDL